MIEKDIDRLYEMLRDLDTSVGLAIYGIEAALQELNKRIRKLEAQYDKAKKIPQSKRPEP